MLKKMLLLSALVIMLYGFKSRRASTFKVHSDESAGINQNAKSQTLAPLPAATTRAIASKAPAAPTPLNPTVSAQMGKIEEIEKCFVSEDCAFPKTDARSYHFAVSAKLNTELKDFFAANKNDLSARSAIEHLAQHELKSLDEAVQATSLEMLASFPPSAETLDAVKEGLQNTSDPLLIEEAMPILQNYLGTQWEPGVHDFLASLIVSGAFIPAQTAAANILPFITVQSYNTYLHTLETMPKNSRASSDLQSALKQFDLLQTGA
jgi:hypothetical protein